MTNLALPPQIFFLEASIPANDDPQETLEWIELPEGIARSEARTPT